MGFDACSRRSASRSATTVSRSRTVARRTVTLGAADLGGEAATEHILTGAPPLLLHRAAILTRIRPRDLPSGDEGLEHQLAGGGRDGEIVARRESGVPNHSQETRHGLEA